MNEIKLNVFLRGDDDKKVQNLRSSGFIPAVIYGAKTKNKSVKVKRSELEKAFTRAGESNLIDLTINQEKPVKVIVKEVQRDAIKNNIIHIDFYQVDMAKNITTDIPLHFIGQSKAVQELGGTLVKNTDTIEVECLPSDLQDHIDVDVSKLENFGDVIRILDLPIPEGMTITENNTESVATVLEPKEEEATQEEATVAEKKTGEEATQEEATVAEKKTGEEAKAEENK